MAKLRLFSLAIKIVAGVLTVFCTLLTIWTVGPTIETKFFPVVSKLVVEKIEWNGVDSTKIWVSFNKKRNCEYLGLVWFKGKQDGDFERVAVVTRAAQDDSNPNRPQGQQSAGPWTVAMGMRDLQSNSFAQLIYKCHPFWVTTTDFYP